MSPSSLKFVVGIEDKQPMVWQLAILLESLHGKLPAGWEVMVVICNDRKPLSPLLSHVLTTYQVRHFSAVNYPRPWILRHRPTAISNCLG